MYYLFFFNITNEKAALGLNVYCFVELYMAAAQLKIKTDTWPGRLGLSGDSVFSGAHLTSARWLAWVTWTHHVCFGTSLMIVC